MRASFSLPKWFVMALFGGALTILPTVGNKVVVGAGDSFRLWLNPDYKPKVVLEAEAGTAAALDEAFTGDAIFFPSQQEKLDSMEARIIQSCQVALPGPPPPEDPPDPESDAS